MSSTEDAGRQALIQLLSSVAFKWKAIATALNLSEDVIAELSKNSDDNARLAHALRLWWHVSKGKDRVNLLITALGDSSVGEAGMSAEIWKGLNTCILATCM